MAYQIIISIACLIVAAGFKALSDSIAHGKSRWQTSSDSFFGQGSWVRKWAGDGFFEKAPSTWYYKLFNLKYREAFPGSATIFVAFTDGWHLSNSLMTSFIVLAIAIWTPWPLWFFIGARIAWGIAFSIAYRTFSR